MNREIEDRRMDGSSKKYHMTMKGVMKWAQHEIKSVGYLAGVEDKDLQYSWAQSIVNGMLHLRDALYELVNDPAYKHEKEELLRMHDKVVRIVKHVIDEYKVNLNDIKQFNTRHVLGPLNYLKHKNTVIATPRTTTTAKNRNRTNGKRRKSRKSRKYRV